MFEWNDQELANIIWGEDGETDDHIVPFPEEIEKKPLPAAVDHDTKKLNLEHASSRAAEKKIPNSQTDSHDVRKDEDEGLHFTRVEPQPEMCSFSTSRSDQNQIAKKAEQDHVAEVGHNQLDDKELGDFVENSWADIGSFDDIDQIFSDDLGGRSPLTATDEPWPSSEDVIGATEKSLALDTTTWGLGEKERASRHFEINVDYLHDQNQSFSLGYGKAEDFMMYDQESLYGSLDSTGHYVGRASRIFKAKAALGIPEGSESYPAVGKVENAYKSVDKEYWCEDQLKHGQQTEKSDYRLLQNAHSSWPTPTVSVQQSDSQSASDLVQHHSPPLLARQRKPPPDSRSLPYQQLSTSYLAPHLCRDHVRQCIAMPVLQSTDDEHQSVLSCYEPSPGDLASLNNLAKASVRPLNMTPQEKIEKLRRRQKLRAMLAIQKQQQQLMDQIPTASCSVRQRSFQQDPNRLMERADVSNVTAPCYDTNSPMKWDEFHEIPVDADGHTLEDTVIHQLQDVISKLDIKIRLCIRDSLFRLAHSAQQRTSGTDTSHTIRSSSHEVVAKEEISSHDRFLRNSNTETETNHIDRAVARLLFHRPVMLPEKYSGTAESSTSTKAPLGQVAGVLSSLPVGSSAKNSENEQSQSLQGSKLPGAFVDTYQEGFFEDILDSKASANQKVKEKTLEHGKWMSSGAQHTNTVAESDFWLHDVPDRTSVSLAGFFQVLLKWETGKRARNYPEPLGFFSFSFKFLVLMLMLLK